MINLSNRKIGFTLVIIAILSLILISSVKVSYDDQSTQLCEVYEEDPELDMSECPAHTSNSISWVILVLFGIGFLIGGLGIYFMNLSGAVSSKFKEINLDELDEEEKKVYSAIVEKEGSIYQSDLIKATKFSKVKVSRILDRMELKKILERKRRGMTNIVILK